MTCVFPTPVHWGTDFTNSETSEPAFGCSTCFYRAVVPPCLMA